MYILLQISWNSDMKKNKIELFLKIIKIIFTIFLITGIILGIVVVIYYPQLKELSRIAKEGREYVKNSSKDTFIDSKTTVVYDCDGNILFTYSGDKDIHYVTIDNIPQRLIDSFIVMEDRNYYSHNGIDAKAVVRALVENYKADSIVQGASTITQQLARNVFLNQEVVYSRKIEEMVVALALEEKYSKNQILEFYLNNIYFGNGYYGVEAAAQGYYGKDVSKLTEGECILLAAVPNNPSKYDLRGNMPRAVERAKIISRELYEAGMMSELDYLLFNTNEENPFIRNGKIREDTGYAALRTSESYVYTYVTRCLIEYLMEANGFVFEYDFKDENALKEYEEKYDTWYTMCHQWLYSAGYSVKTSINLDMQKMLQEAIDNNLLYLDKEDGDIMQGAAVCIDNADGLVTAIVGGRDEEIAGYGLNRGYQSYRQPGSAIKPLNVYAPYLCTNKSPDEVFEDVYNPNGPKNAGGVYLGQITMREAVKLSKNTVASYIYEQLSPDKATGFLTRMCFKKVYVDKNRMAGALGGFTYGVSPEEMAGGFATIVNDGVFRKPTCIKEIGTAKGSNIVLDNSKVIYNVNASRIMTQLLEEAVADGTGTRAKLDTQFCAGKTGTTNNDKDAWFVGYTPYYTLSVWTGYDIPETINLSKGNPGCVIWKEFMEKLHANLPVKYFKSPEEVPTAKTTEEETSEEATSLEEWRETEEVITLPEEEILTAPDEEVVTMPAEEINTLPYEDETYSLPYEEKYTIPYEEILTAPAEEILEKPID